jgi:hypothetical protein
MEEDNWDDQGKDGEINRRRVSCFLVQYAKYGNNTYRAVILSNIAEISGCGCRNPQMFAIGSCLSPVRSRAKDPLLRDISTHRFPVEQKLILYLFQA